MMTVQTVENGGPCHPTFLLQKLQDSTFFFRHLILNLELIDLPNGLNIEVPHAEFEHPF